MRFPHVQLEPRRLEVPAERRIAKRLDARADVFRRVGEHLEQSGGIVSLSSDPETSRSSSEPSKSSEKAMLGNAVPR
jgi:hypothetical protein